MKETSIVPIGPVVTAVSESYGTGDLLFRLGNGGAGATRLLEMLCQAYLKHYGLRGRIDWICNHSRNTQVALHRGYVDAALAYELEYANLAEKEGWSQTAGIAFYDQFCLVGPIEDPARICAAKTVEEALTRIASSESTMHARVDGSATMEKERQLWRSTGVSPWEGTTVWYKTNLRSPSEALIAADKAGAYILTDRSTLLYATSQKMINKTACYFEPRSMDHVLMNPCYALVSATGMSTRAEACRKFVRWLQKPEAQSLIDGYGIDTVGHPLFASVKVAVAHSSLKGGRPVSGKWTSTKRESRL